MCERTNEVFAIWAELRKVNEFDGGGGEGRRRRRRWRSKLKPKEGQKGSSKCGPTPTEFQVVLRSISPSRYYEDTFQLVDAMVFCNLHSTM